MSEAARLDIVALFARSGLRAYGERVTQLSHALQCAALAYRDRADDEVLVATLLHDVGHLVEEHPEVEVPERHHGGIGAALIRPFVPARVAWLVEHHVAAKRYLCSVDPRYLEQLSPVSRRSYAAQGHASPRGAAGAGDAAVVCRRRARASVGRRRQDTGRALSAPGRVPAIARAVLWSAIVGYRAPRRPAAMSADERIGTAERERLASDLALRGGRLALEYFHRAHVSSKPDGSLVADADLAIQERLAAEIARAFPDDAIIGEEAGLSTGPRHALYRWVLDPVDGTNNFARGCPASPVSIGVLRNGQPFAGAVYDPITRWLFAACAGRGAWLNDRPLRTSPAPLSAGSLIAVRTPFEDGSAAVRRGLAGASSPAPLRLDGPAAVLRRDGRARYGLTTIGPRSGISRAPPPCCSRPAACSTLADGAPMFPVAATRRESAPVALLAGNPISHAQALADVTASAMTWLVFAGRRRACSPPPDLPRPRRWTGVSSGPPR